MLAQAGLAAPDGYHWAVDFQRVLMWKDGKMRKKPDCHFKLYASLGGPDPGLHSYARKQQTGPAV